jgi:hypothetical protein
LGEWCAGWLAAARTEYYFQCGPDVDAAGRPLTAVSGESVISSRGLGRCA